MNEFPILRHPPARRHIPVLVSVPHFGTQRIPGVGDEDFADSAFRRFAEGYADAGAAEIYGDLHTEGATVLATPYSRLFVDLNRERSDFELVDGVVRSRRGVVRTHFVGDRSIFTRALEPGHVERRLAQYYDPYHRALDRVATQMLERHGRALVLDAHTGSEKGMGGHEIVIGTRRGRTAAASLRDIVASAFQRHGFEVHHDVPGYSGAHIVRRLGRTRRGQLHAIQVEVNSRLLLATSRREYFERIDRGEPPPFHADNVARLKICLRELVRSAGAAVSQLP